MATFPESFFFHQNFRIKLIFLLTLHFRSATSGTPCHKFPPLLKFAAKICPLVVLHPFSYSVVARIPQLNIFAESSSFHIFSSSLSLPDGRDSSVGIATRYGLEGPGIEYSCGRHFSPSRPAPRTNSASCKILAPYLSWA